MWIAALIAAALIPVVLYGYRRWRARVEEEIAEGAEQEWTYYQRSEAKLVDGLDAKQFQAAYRRAYFPREPGYMLVTIAAVVLATLPILFAMSLIYNFFRLIGMEDPGPWVKGFYFFFGLAGGWAGVAYVFARHFYKTQPGSLREEIIRIRSRRTGSSPRET